MESRGSERRLSGSSNEEDKVFGNGCLSENENEREMETSRRRREDRFVEEYGVDKRGQNNNIDLVTVELKRAH